MSHNKLPVLFISHGSPMLAVDASSGEDFRRWGVKLPKPKAALVFSAHWLSSPLVFGEISSHEKLIYDFAGFPEALNRIQYPASGAPWLMESVQELLDTKQLGATKRGLDHGVWVPLLHLWPQADVPVLQMSMPHTLSDEELFQLGQSLAPLREEGIMIIGSGGLTHNLREALPPKYSMPPDWVSRFEDWVTQALLQDKTRLLRWEEAPCAEQNHPTPEHFRPLLIAAGAASDKDAIEFPVTGFELGIISRRAVQFG